MPDDRRRAELVASLGGLRRRISIAAESAGRDPHSITLVAVTKTYPVEDALTLLGLGVHDLGESRDQEAHAKVDALADQSVRWHMVGQVQTNKVRSVAGYAHAVHSVDRPKLADALADAVGAAAREPLEVFVQISLDGNPERGGVPHDHPADIDALCYRLAERPELRLRGVMAVAPLGADPDAAFARLREVSQQVASRYPGASAISAGMSEDLEAALRHGSTHVRVGSALLGRRSP
jgi:pyridoxal phosphate enzyme (YggS family)